MQASVLHLELEGSGLRGRSLPAITTQLPVLRLGKRTIHKCELVWVEHSPGEDHREM